MPSNYTGVPTSVQAPAAAAATGVAPILALPVDADAFNAAAFAQSYKVLADYVAWATKFQNTVGKSFLLYDEFLGSILTSNWQSTANVTVGADAGNGSGAATLPATGANPNISLETNVLVGAADFYIGAWVRYSVSNTSGLFTVGILAGADGVYLRSTNAGSWILNYGVGVVNTVSTGVAPTAAYQFLEIERISGTVVVRIAGVQVASVVMATALTSMSLAIRANRTAADLTLLCDAVKCWFTR